MLPHPSRGVRHLWPLDSNSGSINEDYLLKGLPWTSLTPDIVVLLPTTAAPTTPPPATTVSVNGYPMPYLISLHLLNNGRSHRSMIHWWINLVAVIQMAKKTFFPNGYQSPPPMDLTPEQQVARIQRIMYIEICHPISDFPSSFQ